MPANDFNIGRDVSLDVVDPNLGPLRFAIKTGWTSAPMYDDVSSKALDGQPRTDVIPNGHRLTMDVDRADPAVDNYFTAREAAYFNGAAVPLVTVTETIREVNGSVSVFRYTGVSLKQGDTSWKGNATTTARIEGTARRKIKIA